MAREAGASARIVEAAVEVNEGQIERMIGKIVRAAGGDVKGKTVAVLGLAFKPNTSDTRDSPAVRIIRGLLAAGARVRAFDPAAMEEARAVLPDIDYARDAYDAARGCDLVVLATEWNQFRNLDWERMRQALRAPAVVDLRNVYDPRQMRDLGFAYTGVGR
jgi:UDPglucose 6-dehydrogenase